jgi:hypothetical protein
VRSAARRLSAGLGLLLIVLGPGCGPQGDAFNETPDGEPVSVRAWVDRADVVPGRPFWMTVAVDQAEDVEFELPDPGAAIQRLELLAVESDPPQKAAGRVLYTQRFQLKAPLPGTYLIPGVEGPWRRGDEVGTAGSGPILVEAKRTGGTEEAGDDELRGLKAVAAPDPNRGPLLAGGLALAALLLVAGFLIARRRGDEPPAVAPPPWEVARQALAALERGGAAQAADQGPFAFEVSAILRRYLEARFGFPAWRMTTPEVLRAMPSELARDARLEQAVRAVLEASDRVKFARDPVTPAELTGWLASVRLVVDRTPAPEETP